MEQASYTLERMLQNPVVLLMIAVVLIALIVLLVLSNRKRQRGAGGGQAGSAPVMNTSPVNEPPIQPPTQSPLWQEPAPIESIFPAEEPEPEASPELHDFREEFTVNLRNMSDSITQAMGEMARAQQAQMDSFAGQLRMIGESEARANQAPSAPVAPDAQYEERLNQLAQVIQRKLNQDDEKIERIQKNIDEKMDQMLRDNQQRLERITQSMDNRLGEALEQRLGESFQLVSERLDQVYKGLGDMQDLSDGVGDLKRVLTGVRAHGLLGEIQLSALLGQILSADQYEQDKQFKADGERVSYAVKLPGRAQKDAVSYLPIDARFPQEAYVQLMDAIERNDAAEIERAGELMENDLYKAAERIQRQFVFPPQTTDFAVLFLPSEGLYAEVFRRPNLAERMQRDYHVMLTGPSTLAALLNSLQMGFKTLAIERRSEEVWALLGAVRGEFINFADALTRTQKRIRQASESIDDAARKSRTIQQKLKGVETLSEAKRREFLNNYDPSAVEDDFFSDGEEWD